MKTGSPAALTQPHALLAEGPNCPTEETIKVLHVYGSGSFSCTSLEFSVLSMLGPDQPLP